ncbi:MAG: hypothetical protein NTY19_23615 [Planctomycetota bacterium]|nr:hypothetical protein [Planctomycetota bacterium]
MKTRNIVQIFVSSPSDCASERLAIGTVAKNLNSATERLSDLTIEVINWDDLYPGIGEYPQQVINQQLPDYDIYVGLWRERFGTETPVALSGTLEELERALDRYEQTRRPWVMCYFWQNSGQDIAPIKEKLKEHGCLYHLFDDTVSFESLFRNHLVSYLRNGFRPRGESTTEGGDITNRDVCMMFRISSLDVDEQTLTFRRPAVAVGRNETRNDIIISDRRVHREQGLFVCREGAVLYVDFGGGAYHVDRSGGTRSSIGPEGVALGIGDRVLLGDCANITLVAVVD